MRKFLPLIILSLIPLLSFAHNSPLVKEGYFVFDSDKTFLKTISKRPELTIDQVSSQGYEVYGPTGTKEYISNFTSTFISLDAPRRSKSAKPYGDSYKDYPSNDDDVALYHRLAETYPNLVQLSSMGKTSTGEDIWVIKISDNAQIDEVEPEFAYIANMHGNEVVGRRLMIRLVEEMLSSYTNGDSEFKSLIENNELFFVPTLNPDGYKKHQRGNGKWVDINRDFPDFASNDNQNTIGHRTEETVAMMNFQAKRHIALSGSFHDGAVVVNYPWDTTAKLPPLHQMITDLSTIYADKNEDMRNSYEFKGGITNGYAWYEVKGGMQDWAFYFHDNLMITFELSDIKWPKFSELERQYQINRESMISYMQKIAQGAGFSIEGLKDSGRVIITSKSKGESLGSFPFFAGEFYKILPIGQYTFDITTQDKKHWIKDVEVLADQENANIISMR